MEYHFSNEKQAEGEQDEKNRSVKRETKWKR